MTTRTRHTLAGLATLTLLAGFGACTATTNNSDDDDDASAGGSGGSAGSGGSGTSNTNTNTNTNTSASGGSGATGTSAGGSGGSGGSGGEAGAGGDLTGGAGADTGGSGGTGGTTSTGSGGSTTGGSVPSDACDDSEVEPNDDRESATAYSIGWEFQACLQSDTDVDWYEFTTPDDGRGGVVTVRITDVGPDGDTEAFLWSALDNGQFHRAYTSTEGSSVLFFFNAKPAASFRLEITNYATLNAPNPYRLTVSYDQVPDAHEPNDTRPNASLIEVGDDVEGYLFGGWESSTTPPMEDWFDWYEVELEAGEASFLLDVVASDIDNEMFLYDPLGTQIAREYTTTEGSSLLLEYEIPEAGAYFLRLNPYNRPSTLGNTSDPPEYATTPYTLTVTQ